jgi:hypothetical protein
MFYSLIVVVADLKKISDLSTIAIFYGIDILAGRRMV